MYAFAWRSADDVHCEFHFNFMPSLLTCERVLATVEWADAALREHKVESGYAMDAVLRGDAQTERRRKNRKDDSGPSESPPPSKFARYQRGDSVPSWQVIEQLFRGGDAAGRFSHPLFDVLKVGLAGYQSADGDEIVLQALWDAERRIDQRLSRYIDAGIRFERLAMTRRRLRDLASCGDSYALTALLCGAMELHHQELDPLLAAQRAFQCMVLMFARGEFGTTWPLLAARVRQQVLDRLEFEGRALDTASVDMAAAIDCARRVIALKEFAEPSVRASRRRQLLRHWLDSADQDVTAITPRIVSSQVARNARANRPVVLQMLSTPRGRFGHVRDYGKSAKAVLRAALGDYVKDSTAEK